jgi:hypothetical protein
MEERGREDETAKKRETEEGRHSGTRAGRDVETTGLFASLAAALPLKSPDSTRLDAQKGTVSNDAEPGWM